MARVASSELESFSHVVEAVYDCALDPGHWQETVRMISELCESQVAFFAIHDYANNRSELTFGCGYTDHYIRLHEEIYRSMNPFLNLIHMQPVGVVKTRAMYIEDREFYESRFYQEWVKPQGWDDAITFNVLQTDQRLGWWAAHRLESCPRYRDDDIRLLSLIAPHVCRSVKISDALNLKTIRSDMLEATLDALCAGVYLVDRLGRIIYSNPAAQRQLETSNALRIENDRLAPVDRGAKAAFLKAISEAMIDEADTPSGGFTLPLPAGDRKGLVASILPLMRGERRNACGAFAATMAVFVQDPVVVPSFPGDAFAKLYGLSGSELRVLLAMAPGLSVREAAEILGISVTTAKTHLQHIFGKTNTSKQTELIRLFASSAPPINVPAEKR